MTNIDNLKRIEEAGVDGLELNFYTLPEKPDIDIETQQHVFPYNLSNPEDKRLHFAKENQ
ncbi:MAG: hypothetical protein V1903_03410 [Bacteroidota bacterium]